LDWYFVCTPKFAMISKTLQISVCLCLLLAFIEASDVTSSFLQTQQAPYFHTLVSESDLRRFLFEHYDKLVRPVNRTTDKIPVQVNLIPVGIRDVNVKEREIKLDTWLYVRWEDDFMKWDADYYGTKQISLPASEVWRPDIAVYTAVSDTSMLPTVLTNVVIFNNGTVLWIPPLTVKSRCPPTELQTGDIFQCIITLGSWTYDVTRLDVHEHFTDILPRAESFHNTHPKWSLESMTSSTELKKYECCEELYPEVKHDLRLRKRPEGSH